MSQDWTPYLCFDVWVTTRKKMTFILSEPQTIEWSGQSVADALTWLFETEKTACKVLTPEGMWSFRYERPLTLEEKSKWLEQPHPSWDSTPKDK